MKRYAEYKDSGIEWIGEIPQGWDLGKIKYDSYVKGRIGWQGLKAEEFINEGPFLVTGTDFLNGKINWGTCYHITRERYEEAPQIQIKNGDLLITKDGTIGKLAIVENLQDKASLNSHLLVVRPLNNKYLTYFLYYIFKSESFLKYTSFAQTGSIMNSLSQDKIENFSFPLPCVEEQQAIANYLDRKTAAIDTLISDKQKLVELLREKRQAIISEAVTKGLDKNAPMKDSGIEWIGEIPQGWTVTRIKNLFSLIDERNEDETAILLSLFTAIGVKPRSEMEEKGNKAVTVMNYKKVSYGDLIVNKLLAWMGAIAYSGFDGVTSPDYDIYRAKRDATVVQDYYHHYFRDTNFKGDCFKYGHGIMMMRWRTYSDEFLDIPVLNPPLKEQIEIAKYVRKISDREEATIMDITNQIQKLKEYRQAIISEAVTGKVAI